MVELVILLTILLGLGYVITLGMMTTRIKSLESKLDFWQKSYENLYELYYKEYRKGIERGYN